MKKHLFCFLLCLSISILTTFALTINFEAIAPKGGKADNALVMVSKIEGNKTILVGEARTDSYGRCSVSFPDDYAGIATIIHPLYEPISHEIKRQKTPKDITLKSKLKERASIYVMGYNVLKGFENSELKKKEFVKWIDTFAPDIILYQELNDFTEESFRDFSRLYGHKFAYIVKEDGYPCGISSRYPLSEIRKVKAGFTHGYIHAKCLGIDIFALHLNPHKAPVRKEEITKIIADIKSLPANANILVEGDFNALSLYDEVAYGPEFVSERVARNPKYKPNYEVTDSMLALPLFDSFAKYSNNRFTKSFPTDAIKSKNKGCRYDYIFLSKTLYDRCRFSSIIHDSTTNSISDHYPNFIALDF